MKFSIRDALLGTVIAAMALGWWLDRSRIARQSPAGNERYELISTGKDNDRLILFNARTGETWERYGNGEWTNFAKFPRSQQP
jgi:hypothetical protein